MAKNTLPAVSEDGEIMVSVGKYARSMVMAVFEDIGGREAMATWAKKNPDAFYTKIFTKTITREVEQPPKDDSIEGLLEVIDDEEAQIAVDADFEDV